MLFFLFLFVFPTWTNSLMSWWSLSYTLTWLTDCTFFCPLFYLPTWTNFFMSWWFANRLTEVINLFNVAVLLCTGTWQLNSLIVTVKEFHCLVNEASAIWRESNLSCALPWHRKECTTWPFWTLSNTLSTKWSLQTLLIYSQLQKPGKDCLSVLF